MANNKTENYIRLLLLNCQGATPVLREILINFVKQTTNKTLGDFLLAFKDFFMTLKTKHILSESEYNKLIRGTAVDTNEWDTSLLCLVLINCCTLKKGKVHDLKTLLLKAANKNLDNFVKGNKSDLEKYRGLYFSVEQYNIMFPGNYQPTEIDLWDLELIVCVLLKVCSGKVKTNAVMLLKQIVQAEIELKNSNLELDKFLKCHKKRIEEIKSQGKLLAHQFENLFPVDGKISDINTWDNDTLCSVVLYCSSSLKPETVIAVKSIRTIRNDCLSHRENAEMKNTDFSSQSTKLREAMNTLIAQEKLTIKAKIDDIVEEVLEGPLDVKSAVDVLKHVYAKESTEYELIVNKLETVESQNKDLGTKIDTVYKGLLTEMLKRFDTLEKKLPDATYSEIVEIKCVDMIIVIKSRTKDGRQKAENIIKTAMEKAGDNSTDKVKAALDVIRTIVLQDGRTIVEIRQGSIVLTIKCISLKSLHGLIMYVASDEIATHLQTLATALTERIDEPIDITVRLSEMSVLNAFEDVMSIISEYVATSSILRMTIKAETVGDIQRLLVDIKGEQVKSQLRCLSEGLSTFLRESITVDVVLPKMNARSNIAVCQSDKDETDKNISEDMEPKHNVQPIKYEALPFIRGDVDRESRLRVGSNRSSKTNTWSTSSTRSSSSQDSFSQESAIHDLEPIDEGIPDDTAPATPRRPSKHKHQHTFIKRLKLLEYFNNSEVGKKRESIEENVPESRVDSDRANQKVPVAKKEPVEDTFTTQTVVKEREPVSPTHSKLNDQDMYVAKNKAVEDTAATTQKGRRKSFGHRPMMEHYDMCVASIEINNVFEGSVYSEDARQFRYKVYPLTEILANISNKIDYTKLIGSKSEGTLIAGSDFDLLTLLKTDVLVDGNQNEAKLDSNIPYLCLTRGAFTPAGYTKLQVYSYTQPCQARYYINKEGHFSHRIYIDNKKNRFLTNRLNFDFYSSNQLVHGPAARFEKLDLHCYDVVLAHQSKAIPHDMACWFDRSRPNDWPPEATREKFKSMGCCYVPLGHSNSPEQDLEWRISPIRQELHLMLNLNKTQYRCYIVLKMIKKYMIQAYCGDYITSYHCKTALFYTIENTASDIWQPRYLLYCVNECLKLLYKCVIEKKCPNYFIPEENMFEKKKVNDHQIKKLQVVLQYLTTMNFTYIQSLLLHLTGNTKYDTAETDSLALVVMELLMKIRSTKHVSNLAEQRIEIQQHIEHIQRSPSQALNLYQEMVCPYKIDIIILLELLEQRLLHVNKIVHREALMARTSYSKRELNTRLPDVSQEDCLKLANISSIQGDLITCDKLLQKCYGLQKRINVLCQCTLPSFVELSRSKNSDIIIKKVIQTIRQSTGNNLNRMSIQDILQHFTCCIEFYGNEMYSVAEPLSFEAYKSVGMQPILIRSYALSETGSISIHPTVYMHFLQHKNSVAMDNKCDANLALDKLEHVNYVSIQDGFYSHPDTILNILGHIYITKGWNRLAVQCFRQSFQMSYYNAAKWHVMFMLFS